MGETMIDPETVVLSIPGIVLVVICIWAVRTIWKAETHE